MDGIGGTGDDSAVLAGDFQERFEYDQRGRQTLHVSFEGVATESDCDAATGRLAEQRFSDNLTAYDDGNGTPAETWAYTYDAFDRNVEVQRTSAAGFSTVTMIYDSRELPIADPVTDDDDDWFYLHNGKQYGPLRLSELREMFASGRLPHSDLAWKQGATTKTRVDAIAELREPFVRQRSPAGHGSAEDEIHEVSLEPLAGDAPNGTALAVASLVLGLLALFLLISGVAGYVRIPRMFSFDPALLGSAFAGSLAAVCLGCAASQLLRASRSGSTPETGLALAGLVIGFTCLGIVIILWVVKSVQMFIL